MKIAEKTIHSKIYKAPKRSLNLQSHYGGVDTQFFSLFLLTVLFKAVTFYVGMALCNVHWGYACNEFVFGFILRINSLASRSVILC